MPVSNRFSTPHTECLGHLTLSPPRNFVFGFATMMGMVPAISDSQKRMVSGTWPSTATVNTDERRRAPPWTSFHSRGGVGTDRETKRVFTHCETELFARPWT